MKNIFNQLMSFIKKNIVVIIFVLLIFIILGVCIYCYFFKPYKVDKDFQSINLDDYNKVMIVAHPDDELLWGGAHLIEDNYLVVCVTCGPIKERVNEFISIMNATNDKYILLGYPDKTNGERDNWDSVYEDISNDLNDILDLKDWDLIVTHNPDGEYGHIHHKMTSKLITDLVDTKEKLYYFGHYHSKKKISEYYNSMVPINDSYLKMKKDLIGLYYSQSFIQTSFDHMFAYEDWVQYAEWGVDSK